jgi:hypothetical protein
MYYTLFDHMKPAGSKAWKAMASEVRIPGHADHSFRRKLTTDSRAS